MATPSRKNLEPEAMSSLLDASEAINAAEGLDETLGAIARAAAAVMKAEASSVILLDRARGKQVFMAAVGDRAHQLIDLEYGQSAGISGRVLRTGKAEIVNDVSKSKDHFKDIDDKTDFVTQCLIAAPLVHRGERLGVVEVINPVGRDEFVEKDIELCRFFANLAAIAAANSRYVARLERENRGLKAAGEAPTDMIGQSPAVEEVRALIRRVALSGATVLLLGETGTGKELAARMIHACSTRAERAFIPVNCAALPETLLESELFGHEAGAFTGATGKRLGRFELADGGTIFLDEIAEVASNIQVKLLRVLEEKEIVRVGGTTTIACDVRIVAATNRDLTEEMKHQRFREDLYYRLNVFPIQLPPLRERQGDVPLLAEFFLKRLAAEMKIPAPVLSAEASAALGQYDFRGNIRELQNVLERACLLCGRAGADQEAAVILPEHLPPEIIADVQPPPEGGSALAAQEKSMIVSALRRCNWNQSRAARELGVSRDHIRYRVRKYGIRKPR